VITVLSLNFSEITLWMMASFFMSILAVASSIRTILLCLRNALQMHSSCFSPADRLVLETLPSSPPFSLMTSSRLHYRRISNNSSSRYRLVKSRFSRKVDLMRVGSWSIIVIECLSSFREY
jgi:hypothetical protein